MSPAKKREANNVYFLNEDGLAQWPRWDDNWPLPPILWPGAGGRSPTEDERIDDEIKHGTDVNDLTNKVFWDRHPEFRGCRLPRSCQELQQLQRQWALIRGKVESKKGGRGSGVRAPQMHGLADLRPWRAQGTKTPVDPSFGESVSTGEFSDMEREAVVSTVKAGVRDANQLSDRAFFARHPDRNGKRIDPVTEPSLAAEWKKIKGRLVLPILEATDLNEKGKQAMFAGQFLRAMSFLDRARRISISPAQNRAGATFNLGIACLQLKRFAAAIGYFEVVRSFPGISQELRTKADKMFAQAKQEYSKAVP